MTPTAPTIRLETHADHRATESLTREAFWNVYRPGCVEHYILHTCRNRDDFVPELDLVMELDGRIIGHIMYVRAAIDADDGRRIPIMTFGPVSIAPDCRRRGHGRALVEFSMRRAAELGAGALCIEGDIGFYGKCGFVVASTRGIRLHGGPATGEAPHFLLKELNEGFLDGITGTYRTPEGYLVDARDVDAFDAGFPARGKAVLPGQLA